MLMILVLALVGILSTYTRLTSGLTRFILVMRHTNLAIAQS
jgi:hypothetical protein